MPVPQYVQLSFNDNPCTVPLDDLQNIPGVNITHITLIEWCSVYERYINTADYYDEYPYDLDSATLVFPNGTTATYTVTHRSTNDHAFGYTDGYTITHPDSGSIITQSPVTRDSFGRVITKPTLTITEV